MNNDETKQVCVLGHGIKHSRSPIIHGYWIKQFQLDACYEIEDCLPDELAGFVSKIRAGEVLGCNVTIPYKQTIIPLIDAVDPAAIATGSINTIYQKDGQLRGTSTDGSGYLAHLSSTYPDFDIADASILILGAGGAARSIMASIVDAGCLDIHVANRTLQNAQQLCELKPSTCKAIAWSGIQDIVGNMDLVINTTSLGQKGHDPLEFPVTQLPERAIVSDIVYVPLETELLKSARLSGRRTLDGLGMLLHQAVPGFELWFGKRPEVTDKLRQLVEADLVKHG